ncbi:telomerase protein component 1-like [Asterias amurensis]|uniref:telomerase protein component 1-like n=1 Tax=Asterias amurensis TaxID=7602 RepID=UPI003AB48208
MGCGSSNAAGSYQSDVNTMWNQVRRTVDSSTKTNDKTLVIRRSGWKTVRIFVSSTFRDFHAEREILIKEVFPDLRVWCEKRRLHLVDCDLRWGIPKDTTTEETLRTCLGEIDRCYQDNVMPFFLNLTSERCGWIPNQMEVPPSIRSDYRWIQGLSVTEMEIMHGAYRKDNFNSLFMIRDSSFLQQVPKEHHKDFVDVNPIAPAKLQMLKQMLKERFRKDQVSFYNCEFDGVNDQGKVEFNGLEKTLGKMVYEFFQRRITEQYPLEDGVLDPYQQAKEAHESFMKNRSASVLGRTNILEQMKEHIIGIGVDVPLLLLGGPGTGKSSIMARVADVTVAKALTKEIPGGGEQGWHVFYHFVGAVPGSPNLEMTLKRLLRELGEVNDTTMPQDLESACQVTYAVLSNPNTKPVIIIIDALNQFDECKEATVLNWLPSKLGPQIRCIFSMIDETPQHQTLHSRPNKPLEVYVTPLDMSSREAIVQETLGNYQKRLDAEQMASLLSKESSQNPLWLSVACEELRVYGIFEKLSDKINSLADGLLNLLEQVLTRFEEENGGQLLVASLCLLECSCRGLLETELLNILGDEDNLMPGKNSSGKMEKGQEENREKTSEDISPLSAHKWARIFRALKPFLRPFGDSGEGRLDFYHRALSKAVRAKYFDNGQQNNSEISSEGIYDWWHTKLANHFEGVTNLERKSEEYPHHLVKINDKKRLIEFLKDWDVFHHYYIEAFSGELLALWRQASDNQKTMEECYLKALEVTKDDPKTNLEDLGLLYEKVARVFSQSNQLEGGFALLEKLFAVEEELGNRPERMMLIYDLAASLSSAKVQLHNFIVKAMMPDLKPAIQYRMKALELSKDLKGEQFRFKRAMALTALAFCLRKWVFLRGDNSMSASEARELFFDSLKEAKEIFEELGDQEHIGGCIMTEAMLRRDDNKQVGLKLYKEAEEIIMQSCGEMSIMGSRIVINMAILFEEMGRHEEAYDYWQRGKLSKIMLKGIDHPSTQRVLNSLNQPRMKRVAEKRLADEKLLLEARDSELS